MSSSRLPDTGNGATIVFIATGFTARYTSIGGATAEIPELNDSYLATTGNETYVSGDLVDRGTQQCELFYDPDTPPTVGYKTTAGIGESITITYPVPPGLTNGATKTGTGFIKSFTEPEMVNNQLMKAQFVIRWDGKSGPTYAIAT